MSQISKYASDERIEGIFCARRKPANFCHPATHLCSLNYSSAPLCSGSTFLIQPASKGLFFCPPLIFSQQGLRYYKQPVNLSCRPTMLTQLFSHWSTITFTDLLTAAYLVFLVIFVFGCNYLFTNFVDSKPEGRKTVLG